MEHNFNKIATLNQGTPYDYNSVMQYFRTAFSKNGQPTMIPIPNANVSFGNAKEMSRNDKSRLNTLYQCCECPHDHIFTPVCTTHQFDLTLLSLLQRKLIACAD
ncbi:hypothetical protein PBY51_019520 [Eleginops maclovinus]|nr:hypothetical protein PBY51_019520 [Eleginops maclovinus]